MSMSTLIENGKETKTGKEVTATAEGEKTTSAEGEKTSKGTGEEEEKNLENKALDT